MAARQTIGLLWLMSRLQLVAVQALTPVVEGVMAKDMVRFKDIAVAKAQRLQQQRQQQQVPQ